MLEAQGARRKERVVKARMTIEDERILDANAAILGVSRSEALRRANRWLHIHQDEDVIRRLDALEESDARTKKRLAFLEKERRRFEALYRQKLRIATASGARAVVAEKDRVIAELNQQIWPLQPSP